MQRKNNLFTGLLIIAFIAGAIVFNISNSQAVPGNDESALVLKIVSAKLGCSYPISQNPHKEKEPTEFQVKIWIEKLAADIKTPQTKRQVKKKVNNKLLRIPDKSFNMLWKNLTIEVDHQASQLLLTTGSPSFAQGKLFMDILLEVAVKNASYKIKTQISKTILKLEKEFKIVSQELSNAVFDRDRLLDKNTCYPKVALAMVSAYSQELAKLESKSEQLDQEKAQLKDNHVFNPTITTDIREQIHQDPFVKSICEETIKAYKDLLELEKKDGERDAKKLHQKLLRYYKKTYENVTGICLKDYKTKLDHKLSAVNSAKTEIEAKLNKAIKKYSDCKIHKEKIKKIELNILVISSKYNELEKAIKKLKNLQKEYTPLTIIMLPVQK